MSRVIRIFLPAAAALWAAHGQAAWAAPAAPAAPAAAAPAAGATCACGMNAATCPHCSPAANRPAAAPAAAPAARPAAPATAATCACGKPAGACPRCAARAAAGAAATTQPNSRVCACGKPAGSCTGACARQAAPAAAATCACGKPAGSCNGACARQAAPAAAATCACGKPAGACNGACARQGAPAAGDRPATAAACACGNAACNGACARQGAHHGGHHGMTMRHRRMMMHHGHPSRSTELRYILGGAVAGGSANHHLGVAQRHAIWPTENFGIGLERAILVQLNPTAGVSSWVSPHLGVVPMLGKDLGPVRIEASAMAGLGLMLRTGAGDALQVRGNWVAEPRLALRTKPGALGGLPIGLGLAGGYLFSAQAPELSGPTLALRATFR